MPVLAAGTITTHAQKCAVEYWGANRTALASTQQRLTLQPPADSDTEFVFARDGSLSALQSGRWLAGCSVPTATARKFLEKLELRCTVGCFLNPTHAAQIREAFNHLTPTQALIAVIADEQTLQYLLHCEDLSAEISGHRLWFTVGDQWAAQLADLLSEHPGLPVPGQFIRTPLTPDERLKPLISAAQEVFSEQTRQRETRLAAWASGQITNPRPAHQWCIVAGSQFRLWQGAADVLWRSAGTNADDPLCVRYDPDDPASASPLALAECAADCGGVVAADLARGDFAPMIPMDKPWVTWVSSGRIPSANCAGPNDRLLVADPQWGRLAAQAGWAANRVKIAPWPTVTLPAPQHPCLTLLANTRPIESEPEMELSSHRLLWQAIHHELSADPFILTSDPLEFLRKRRAKMSISEEGFDAARFVNELLLPTYDQSLARLLLKAGLPLALWGREWSAMDEFACHWHGTLDTRQEFHCAIRQATVLVQPWPQDNHPGRWEIQSFARPILHAAGQTRLSLARRASELLRHPPPAPSVTCAHPTLSAALLQHVCP